MVREKAWVVTLGLAIGASVAYLATRKKSPEYGAPEGYIGFSLLNPLPEAARWGLNLDYMEGGTQYFYTYPTPRAALGESILVEWAMLLSRTRYPTAGDTAVMSHLHFSLYDEGGELLDRIAILYNILLTTGLTYNFDWSTRSLI